MEKKTELNRLTEKRRKKYWQYKETDDNDWRKKLYALELESLVKRIEFLEFQIANDTSKAAS